MIAKKLLLPLVALMLACTALTVQADPFGPSCGGAHTSLTDNVDCVTVAGPASAAIKPIVSAGLAVCDTTIIPPGAPLFCDNPAGSISSAGGAAFGAELDADFGDGAPEQALLLEMWVKYNPGSGICGVGGLACGFDVLLCDDRDLDSTCTNVGDNSDRLKSTESNDPIVGEPCEENDKFKDDKDCGDPEDAYVAQCMPAAEDPTGTADDWVDGQVVGFIGAWAGSNIVPADLGAGAAVGTFDVWLRWSTCTLPECDDGIDNADADAAIDQDDPECEDFQDDSEGPDDDGIPLEPISCVATRHAAAGGPDVITAECDGSAAACTQAPGPGANDVTVTCDGVDGAGPLASACFAVDVEAVADLVIGADDVTTTISCAGVAISTAFDAVAGPGPVVDEDTKTTGAYLCTIVFDWNGAGAYGAYGICQDDTPAFADNTPLS